MKNDAELKLVKKKLEKAEKELHWASRVSQSKLWHKLEQIATQAYADNSMGRFTRTIDMLVDSTFKEDRDRIIEYQHSLVGKISNKEERYRLVLRFTVDLLEPYLRYFHTPYLGSDDSEYEGGTVQEF